MQTETASLHDAKNIPYSALDSIRLLLHPFTKQANHVK